MGATLHGSSPERNAGTPHPRRWGAGRSDPVARLVAPILGLSPASAEHRLRNCFAEAAHFIRGFHALGDHVRLCRAIAPIDAALAEATPPELTTDLCIADVRADAAEHEAVLRLIADMSDANKRACLRRLDAAIAATQKLRRAVAASLGPEAA